MDAANYWFSQLVAVGCVDAECERLETMCDFLVVNEFTHVDQLREADHPREWPGAERLSQAAVEAVWRLVQRQRSRRDQPSHV